jgi:iron complex transport system permease protein
MKFPEKEKNYGYLACRLGIPFFLKWKNLAFITFLLLPVPVFFFSIFLGTYSLSPLELIRVLLSHFTGYEYSYPSVYDTVIFNIRFPRVLLAMIVGAALSTSGATFQGIFRNPLVSPYILGLSSGAAFGAALSIAVIPKLPAQVGAFIFSLVALGFSYTMARTGRQTSTVALILSGVITTSVFGALLSIIQYKTDEKAVQSIVYWTLGCLHTACWSKFSDSFPLVFAGCLIIYLLRWKLNVLALGEEEAKAVGMNVELYKAIFIIAATLAVSAAVAVAGIIGLLGLIVPHILRMIFGPDHRKIIPLSITFGAAFLALVDDIARSTFGFEIPVGIITTLLGAPFFLYLLRTTKIGGWE